MEIHEISLQEYIELTKEIAIPFYCRGEFIQLNSYKVEKIHCLLGEDTKKRLIAVFGEEKGRWKAPFSAPFYSITELQKYVSVSYYWEFISLITEYIKSMDGQSIELFLPPDLYCEQINAKSINAFLGNGYEIQYLDLNFALDLTRIDLTCYNDVLHRNARKNLNIALKSEMCLVKCCELQDKIEAYNVIKRNRESKGYPLRMTLEQVLHTSDIVEHDFFIVKHNETSIAAAVVFHVTKDIVQVIYWGDIPNVGELKPINYLAYKLIEYYQSINIKIIDIGPSTEEGQPNFGLCDFKESIGCNITSKYRLLKKFDK